MPAPWTPALRAALKGPPRDLEERLPGRLWRLRDATGALWLKRCASTRAASAEVHVMRAILPGAPRLRAHDLAARALLMEELPGDDLARIGLTEDPSLHARAGRWLARLHALPVEGEDTLPIEAALQARLASLERRLPDPSGLPLAELRAAARALRLPQARRVWCHRDYQPRNWRWDGHALYVLDFEHARPDLWLADLAKLRAELWVGRPELEAAFLQGYGRALSAPDEAALRVLVGLHGLFALTWGQRHGEAEFVALGRRILERWGP